VAAPRLLVVVAHPDDETFGCGSLLLHAAARGAETTVCCLTRGDAGQPRPGSGVTREELPVVREAELRAAAAALDVATVVLLDHRDSDMEGEPHPEALVAVPFDAVVADVRAVIEHHRPHVVVTLDASDGHRDHARARDATLAAVDEATWQVDAVHLQCLPRSLLRRWADHTRARDPDSPYLDVDEVGFGTPDELVTTRIDTREHLARRWAAIALHASQASPFDDLPPDLAEAFLGTEHLRRVRPSTPPPAGHDELFEGQTGLRPSTS
jgi:LmbE family N-acetylglucosaminyl deacetylase